MELRPNNWFINRIKLESVREVWKRGKQDLLAPVLVTKIDGELSLIDGHAKAFTAFERGETHLNAVMHELEHIDGYTELYIHIHREGPKKGIKTIADLCDRIVSPDDHKRLWVDYCTKWIEKNKK